MNTVWEDFPDVVLQVAGAAPGVGRDPAVWMAADPRVKVINSPSEEDKDRLLTKARMVVNPSLTESFGITTLEAWAQGTPVVVADSPVNRSVVRDGVDGLVASGPKADDLARALMAMFTAPDKAMGMGRSGRERIQRQFNWTTSAEDLESLLMVIDPAL
jgi:glycosyltransferase involved in cell wall biosynthesis